MCLELYTDRTATGWYGEFPFSLKDRHWMIFFPRLNYWKSTHLADQNRKNVRLLCGDACVGDVNAFGYLVNALQQKLYGPDDLTNDKYKWSENIFDINTIGDKTKCCHRYSVVGSYYLHNLVRCIVGYLARRDLWVLRYRCPFSKVYK